MTTPEKKAKQARHIQSPVASAPYAPTCDMPVRCTSRAYKTSTAVSLHSHDWAQLAFAESGVVRVHTERTTYTAPPGRAIWIPAQTAHCASVLEQASMLITFIGHAATGAASQPLQSAHWQQCKILETTALLRALLMALEANEQNTDSNTDYYRHLSQLFLIELSRAPALSLGVPLPADKRLRQICQAILKQPNIRTSIAALAAEYGASVSTLQRLSRTELGSSFSAWRQQVILSHAFVLAAKGWNTTRIADALGYSSVSAFSYFVKQHLGITPRALLSAAALSQTKTTD